MWTDSLDGMTWIKGTVHPVLMVIFYINWDNSLSGLKTLRGEKLIGIKPSDDLQPKTFLSRFVSVIYN